MTIRFDCTQCGRCCHDLRLTLSVAEALAWAAQGLRVQLLCEAIPWPGDPEPADEAGWWRRACSFPARSGAVPVRIAVLLVAVHDGACPHLQPDMRCGQYATRPRICRIYPLESRRFTAMVPTSRLCPPEAWSDDRPALAHGDQPADPTTRQIIAEYRALAASDMPAKALACQRLAIATAGFANEGFAVHEPPPQALIAALEPGAGQDDGQCDWAIISNRQATVDLLRGAECNAGLASAGAGYLGSFPAAA